MCANRILTVAALCFPAVVFADEPKAQPTHPLVGTWKCVSAKYDDKASPRPDGYSLVKHVTPTQFMWAIYDKDGKVEAVLGGAYTVKGKEYVEVPEYGTAGVLEDLKGKPQQFTWRIDGNKWIHVGKLSSGVSIEEVWERVEKK
jgi:hypothetical protein